MDKLGDSVVQSRVQWRDPRELLHYALHLVIIVGPDRRDKLLASVIEARKTGQGRVEEMQNRI